MNAYLALAIFGGLLGWILAGVTLLRLGDTRERLLRAQQRYLESVRELHDEYGGTIEQLQANDLASRATLEQANRRISALTLTDPVLLERAGELTKEADTLADVTGEFKRHQVYAKLQDELPDRRKRDLAYAIELALR